MTVVLIVRIWLSVMKMAMTTNYILMRRCLVCWHISEMELRTCSLCGHVFLSEASDEEKLAAMKKITDQKLKSELNRHN